MFENWVIDASMSDGEMLCYIPIEEDGMLVTGMNLVRRGRGDLNLVGIVHPDGDDAIEEWIARMGGMDAVKAIAEEGT